MEQTYIQKGFMNIPKKINYSAAIKYGFVTYIDNFFLFFKIFIAFSLTFLGLAMMVGLIAWSAGYLIGPIFLQFSIWGGTARSIISQLRTLPTSLLIIKLLIFVFFGLLFEYFFYQIIRLGLKLYDNKTVDWTDFFDGDTSLFWDFMFARIWYSIKVIFGLILLIIPGIYFGVTYYFSGFAILDRKALSVKEDALIAYSLGISHFKNLFWFAGILWLLSEFLNNFFALLLFAPILILARVHAYKQLTTETSKEPHSMEMTPQS